MPAGSIKWFADGLLAIGNKQISLSADTFNIGIVTNAVVPSINTPVPHWGGTGTTNFLTNQVGIGGGYTGPFTLSGVSWTNVSGVPTFRASDPTIPANASGFTNGAYGIIYSATDPNKRAIGFIELNSAGTASIVSGAIILDFGGSGSDVLTMTPS